VNPVLVPTIVVLSALQAGSDSPPARHFGNERARVEQAILSKLDLEFARVRLEMLRTLDAEMPIPFLGIDTYPPEKGRESAPLRLSKIFADSGALAAGLQVDDVLLEIAGKRVTNVPEIRDAIRANRAGDRIPVHVQRAGRDLVVMATLGRRPFDGEDEDLEVAPPPEPLVPRSVDFESMPVGSAPAGMRIGTTGLGEPARFLVVAVEGAPSGARVLRQESNDAAGYRFPFAVLEGSAAGDFHASTSFRFVSGESDRAAGLVFRFQDQDNYLVARANELEKDVRLFRVLHGVRRQVPGAMREVDLSAPGWHRMEVTMRGHDIAVRLDGKLVIESADTNWVAGAIGLWTKSDAVTEFDDLAVGPVE
jgi:PDZ domain-containing protein